MCIYAFELRIRLSIYNVAKYFVLFGVSYIMNVMHSFIVFKLKSVKIFKTETFLDIDKLV